MSLFQKREQKGKKLLPSFLFCTLAFFLLSLLFLLCYNQKEYMMEGEENDYLVGTIWFFALSVLASFMDFAFYFSFEEESPLKKWFLLGSFSFELISYIVGIFSYFRLYNETVSSIVAVRIVIVILGFLLFSLNLFSRLVAYFKIFKKQKNNAKIISILNIFPFVLANEIALLFPIAVFETMQVPFSHYSFVFLLIDCLAFGLFALFLFFFLQKEKIGEQFLWRCSHYFFAASIALIAITLLLGIVAYANKDSLSFRSFYWLVASSVFVLAIDVLYFLYRYFAKNPQRIASFEDEKE